MARPLLMDVDTGVDDAIALALASQLETHQLVGVTTVAGNVPIDLATRNTLRVLSWIGADVPVFRGMSRPLVRPLQVATSVHGADGLGGWAAPDPPGEIEPGSAPEAILRLARKHRGELDGVFVGPLTNLAVALALEPELVDWFHNVTIMGGAFRASGNVSPAAEFNVFVDPEAAQAVATSGLGATWIGLDVTHQTSLERRQWEQLAALADQPWVLVREVSRQSFELQGRDAVYLHDPLAVAVASDPTLVELETGQVLVERGHFARGETRLVVGMGVSNVATRVDAARFAEFFRNTVGLAPKEKT